MPVRLWKEAEHPFEDLKLTRAAIAKLDKEAGAKSSAKVSAKK